MYIHVYVTQLVLRFLIYHRYILWFLQDSRRIIDKL